MRMPHEEYGEKWDGYIPLICGKSWSWNGGQMPWFPSALPEASESEANLKSESRCLIPSHLDFVAWTAQNTMIWGQWETCDPHGHVEFLQCHENEVLCGCASVPRFTRTSMGVVPQRFVKFLKFFFLLSKTRFLLGQKSEGQRRRWADWAQRLARSKFAASTLELGFTEGSGLRLTIFGWKNTKILEFGSHLGSWLFEFASIWPTFYIAKISNMGLKLRCKRIFKAHESRKIDLF